MKSETIMPEGVEIPPRLRAVDPVRVKALAESMEAIGLQQPITCWQNDTDEIVLVAGAHRLEAAKLLGWEWIDAVFTKADEIDRQLWEIDENLMRAELTPTQQAEHLAKRKELWEAREVSGKVCSKPQGGRPQAFASDTAEKTGVSKRAVNLAIARANAIPEDVRDQIRGTDLDKGTYLDSIKKLAPEAQRERVLSDLAAPTRPKVVVVVDADEEQFEALKRAWNKSSATARQNFIDWLSDNEPPVFDNG